MGLIFATIGAVLGVVLLIGLVCKLFLGWSWKKYFSEILEALIPW